MIQLLTMTGARPLAFSLCVRWMERQTYLGPVTWIIVDDGPEEIVPPSIRGWSVGVVRPTPRWSPGENTQARNILAGLEVASTSSPLFVIEDDDWYSPDYLRAATDWAREAPLVGEGRARYYNVASRRGMEHLNRDHASLCSTGMDGSMIPAFRDAVNRRGRFIDIDLWARAKHKKVFTGTHHCVGIKGLPGRPGIGMGHAPEFRGKSDPDGALLRSWIGNDAEVYLGQACEAP